MYSQELRDAENFSEGLAAFSAISKSEDNPDLFGYIDKSGKIIIPAKFYEARQFSSGMAVVGIREYPPSERSYTRFTLIDRQGKFIVNNPKAYANDRLLASEGLAAMSIDEKWGFVDKTGKFVIPPHFPLVGGGFVDGLAPVMEDKQIDPKNCDLPGDDRSARKYGYIDRTGKFVIPPKFNSGNQPFRDGLAYVGIMYEPDPNLDVPEISAEDTKEYMEMLKKLAGYHPNGFRASELSPQERSIMKKFEKNSQAQASVYKGGVEGYIDPTGKFIWKKEYRN